jgi:hypothetical protein
MSAPRRPAPRVDQAMPSAPRATACWRRSAGEAWGGTPAAAASNCARFPSHLACVANPTSAAGRRVAARRSIHTRRPASIEALTLAESSFAPGVPPRRRDGNGTRAAYGPRGRYRVQSQAASRGPGKRRRICPSPRRCNGCGLLGGRCARDRVAFWQRVVSNNRYVATKKRRRPGRKKGLESRTGGTDLPQAQDWPNLFAGLHVYRHPLRASTTAKTRADSAGTAPAAERAGTNRHGESQAWPIHQRQPST